MKNILKKLSLSLISVSILFSVVGCGTSSTGNSTVTPSSTPTNISLTIGASTAPHAEILEFAKPLLKEKGINLDIKIFTDYVLPNTALESGELGANYFQHQPYLDDFNIKNGTDIVSVGKIHFEPLGIYPGKSKSLENIASGASIALPSDVTNEARALQLLESLKLITLKKDAGLSATIRDITENPHQLKFIEVEAAQIPRTLPDVDFGIANGNYALEAGIESIILASEDKGSEGAQKFANIVAVKKGSHEDASIKILIDVLHSKEVADFINHKYKGIIVPIQ